MDTLGIEELDNLVEEIDNRLKVGLIDVISNCNRSHTLEELLSLLGMSDLIPKSDSLESDKLGKIVVIGGLHAKKKDLLGVANKLGLNKNRFDFVSFEESKTYNYNQLKFNSDVAVILMGPTPHKTAGAGEYSSVLANFESNSEIYPPVKRMVAGGKLKITKSNFEAMLNLLIKNRLLLVDD